MLDMQHRGTQMDCDHPVERFHRKILDPSASRTVAGIVHEDVDASIGLGRRCDSARRIGFL